MLFNSVAFLVFFPVVAIVYYLLPHKMRWISLLIAGIIFYAWSLPYYLIVIGFLSLVTYLAGQGIEKHKKKGLIYATGIIAILLLLITFKYSAFFSQNMLHVAKALHLYYPYGIIRWIVPLGLSFQSFMALAYLIELKRGNIPAEKNFGIFSLYLLFFPIVISGPIERPQNLIPQFRARHEFQLSNLSNGLRLILWGFFKKIVIADHLALVVNQIYNNPQDQNGLSWMLGTFFFAFQLYFDFSAYTHIAIGSAKIMGFTVSENFNTPFAATSVTDFWRRWHITLSTWLRDYLFTPLSIKWRRSGRLGLMAAIMLTFIICGFWHEAGWTFIIWGGIHGLFLGIESQILPLIEKKRKRSGRKMGPFTKALAVLFTFSLLGVSWVFFRSGSVSLSLDIIQSIADSTVISLIKLAKGMPVFEGLGPHSMNLVMILTLAIISIYVLELLMKTKSVIQLFHRSVLLRFSIYFILLYAIVFLGNYGETVFIYAKF